MPHLDPTNRPTVFGVSGYSGAGTKSGEKDAEGRPKTVAKVVSCFFVFFWLVSLFLHCGEEKERTSVAYIRSREYVRSGHWRSHLVCLLSCFAQNDGLVPGF